MIKSKFEEIIGDLEAFRLMLDGVFKDWDGSYDVLAADTQEYLFDGKKHPKFRPFCYLLRSYPKGYDLCKTCDAEFDQQIAQNLQKADLIYFCHIGLMDTAVPIVIQGEHLATVFFGQVRLEDADKDKEFFRRVRTIEQKLNFEQGTLENLAKQTPQVSRTQIESMQKQVKRVAYHISHMGYDRQQLDKAAKQAERRQKASDALQRVTPTLADLSTDVKIFWRRVEQMLLEVGEAIGASSSLILSPIGDGKNNRVRAVAGMPAEHFKNQLYDYAYDPIFAKLLTDGKPVFASLDQFSKPETISGSIQKFAPDLAAQLNKTILTRIDIANDGHGVLFFFFKKDFSEHLPEEEIMGLAVHSATLIGTAYHNRILYLDKKNEIEKRQVWLEQVTHQLLAPLNSLRGHAENAYRQLGGWERQISDISTNLSDREIQRWKFSLESIMWNAHYASRLASNLGWVVFEQKRFDGALQLVDDVGRLLIRSIRNFQGLARERNLRGIRVDTQSLIGLDNNLCIFEDTFRQAFENIIDNAVKYSFPNTEIIIEGECRDTIGMIHIINEGIRLKAEDTERIFEYEYRTVEARQHNAPGTGIGLFVTRKIVKMHGGELTAQPSIETEFKNRWRTIFTITLPLRSNCH